MNRRRILILALTSLVSVILAIDCSKDNVSSINPVPAAPSDLVARAISSSVILLFWADNSENETCFIVYRCDDSTWMHVATSSANEVSYEDSLLQDTSMYLYYVVAKNDYGSSTPSETASVITPSAGLPPDIPHDPVPSHESDMVTCNPRLQWDCSDPDGDILTYDVSLGTQPDPPVIITDLSSPEYYPDTLEYNMTYFWKVTARDNHGHQTLGPVWTFTTRDSQSLTLTVSIVPQEAGSVTVSPDSPAYHRGDTVTMQAVPASNYVFDRWTIGMGDSLPNPILIVFESSDLAITAHFIDIGPAATINGTVTWPGHSLSSRTRLFADTLDNNLFFWPIGDGQPDTLTGTFTLFLQLPAPQLLYFRAWDDVNGNQQVDAGDGWGFYDPNSSGNWDTNDCITVEPGQTVTNVNITLQQQRGKEGARRRAVK